MKNKKTLKKVILGSFFLLGSVSLFAQTQKVHTLQAKNTSTSTTMNSDALIQMDSDNKGLLLPRIALTGANQVAPLTAHTAGMVVYNTATVAATATIEAVTPGYYYNNGTKWVKIANTDTADITNDAWVNNTTTNVVELATKADGTTRTAGSKMVIKDDGKVGIGKITPEARLHVQTADEKVAQFYYGGHISTPRLYINGSANKISLKTGYNVVGADLALGTHNNNESILIKEAGNLLLNKDKGNVGIGVTSPNAKLDVQTADEKVAQFYYGGHISTPRLYINGSANKISLKTAYNTGGADLALGTHDNNESILIKEAGNLLLNKDKGNVGIGTETPQAKLDIRDNDGASLIIRNATKAHTDTSLRNYIDFRDKDDVSYGYVGEGSIYKRFSLTANEGYDLVLATYADQGITARGFLIMNSTTGNVGIGTNTPSEKLQVIGNVKAESFISATTTYPDYVFEKYYKGFSKLNNEYNFKALPEVEAFIKVNGHLPGYKPANEIIEAGSFNVTESHLMNVEKIEELYLHTIEQDKKLKAQQKENNELKQRVQKLEALVTKLIEAKK